MDRLYYPHNAHTSHDLCILAHKIEVDTAREIVDLLERGKPFYYKNIPQCLQRRIEQPEKYGYIPGTDHDYVEYLWMHFDANSWIHPLDCADYTGFLWLSALARVNLKFTKDTYNHSFEDEWYGAAT